MKKGLKSCRLNTASGPWFGRGRFPGISPKKGTYSGASGSSLKTLYLASNPTSVVFYDEALRRSVCRGEEGHGHRGPFSRSSIGPGLKGHEKETIISLRQSLFPTREAPGRASDHLQARGQLKIFPPGSSTNEKCVMGWVGEQYLILLTTKNRECRHIGARLALSSQLATDLPAPAEIRTLEVHLAQGQLTPC